MRIILVHNKNTGFMSRLHRLVSNRKYVDAIIEVSGTCYSVVNNSIVPTSPHKYNGRMCSIYTKGDRIKIKKYLGAMDTVPNRFWYNLLPRVFNKRNFNMVYECCLLYKGFNLSSDYVNYSGECIELLLGKPNSVKEL